MSGAGDKTEEDNVSQPRQPRNLQDLIRYSIEAGSSQTQEVPEERPEHLNPERRRFLDEALQYLTEDVTKELAEAIQTLKTYQNSHNDDISTYECALDIISDRVDSIDCANDYCKLGGFDIVAVCLSSTNKEIRWRICDIIAQCTQNNPFCQQQAIKYKFLESLLQVVDKDHDEKCKTKAFFAVSNIVRDNTEGLQKFRALDGFSVVLRSMQSNNDKLRNKSTFFLSSVLSQQHDLISEVYNMGFVEQLVSLIQREHSTIHEHIVSTLLTMAKNYEPAQKECRRPELILRSTLLSIVENYQNDDAFSEEMAYIKELMNLVFTEESEEER